MPLNIISDEDMQSQKSERLNILSDEDMQKQAQPQSSGLPPTSGFLSYLESAIPGGPIFDMAARNPQIFSGKNVGNLLKSIPNAAGQVVSGLASTFVPFSPLSDFLGNVAQGIPTPSPEGSNALALAANVIGGAKALEGVPELAKLGMASGKDLLQTLGRKLGINAEEKATNYMQGLLQGNDVSEAHLPVLKEIRNIDQNNQDISQGLYNSVKQNAADRGYIGGKQFAGITPNTGTKSIIPNNFQNEVGDLDLKDYPQKIQDLLDPFNKSINNNLSFADAHDLQSTLGNEGAKLLGSSDSSKRSTGFDLLDLRRTLKNDIVDNFQKNGDQDLANQYQDASNFYLNNLAPQRENSTLRKVILGKGTKEVNPSNIGTVLKKDDGSVMPIANQLSPQSKNLLLGQQLSGASELSPEAEEGTVTLQRSTNPADLISRYGQLDNKGYRNLMTPQNNQAILDIKNSLSKKEFLQAIQNKLQNSYLTRGALLGLGGLSVYGGYRGVRDLTEE